MKNQPLPRFDDNPELTKKLLPFCRLQKGDAWEDGSGKFRVGCVDIASKSDVENLMNGEKATLSIQDPPYNFIAFQESQVSEFIDCADLIDERFEILKNKIEGHLKADEFQINFGEMLSYWGKYYLFSELPENLTVKVWKDLSKFEKGVARIRDVFHYESMLDADLQFDKMIVANTGFSKHIKTEKALKVLPIEIITASSRQLDLFE